MVVQKAILIDSAKHIISGDVIPNLGIRGVKYHFRSRFHAGTVIPREMYISDEIDFEGHWIPS